MGDVLGRLHALAKASALGFGLVLRGAAVGLDHANDVPYVLLAGGLQVLTSPVSANLISRAREARWVAGGLGTPRRQFGNVRGNVQGVTDRIYRNLFPVYFKGVDMAIAPFVRQFAGIDARWWQAQPWPRLQEWLAQWQQGSLLASVMDKRPAWVEGAAGVVCPRPSQQHLPATDPSPSSA